MKQKMIVTVAMAAALAGMAFAQRPGRFGGQMTPPTAEQMQQRHIQRLTTLLNLTEAQQQQASTIFASSREQAEAVQPQIRTAETSLREAVKANNTAQIDTLAGEIGRLQGQMRAIQAKSQAQFYALLTTEQRAKYDELGPGGGMMGPGPGAGPMGRRAPRQ